VITEDLGFATQLAHSSHPLRVLFDYTTVNRHLAVTMGTLRK